MKRVAIIGGGFSGLSAACYLGRAGYDVTVYEKNSVLGGRARVLERDGFKFDMGPTFYWMPDIFEKFFNDFDKKSSDYYELIRLDPGYEIYFGPNNSVRVSADVKKTVETFENIEPGSGAFLENFLKSAEFNYRVAIDKVVEKPGKSIFELIMPQTIARVSQFKESISQHIRKNIKDDRLRQILEFPVLFLGAKPSRTPLFYCFMNYADMVLGTWHIKGGMYGLVEAMVKISEGYGVKFITDAHVNSIITEGSKAVGISWSNTSDSKEERNSVSEMADFIISSADYHFAETLLEPKFRNYSEKYWSKRVFAPSAMLYYVGFDKKLEGISHHTLFFDADFIEHSETIYDTPRWPNKPLFYGSFPSVTDPTLAPKGKECAVFLIPVAAGLKDTPELRENYFLQILERIEQTTGIKVSDSVLFKESYSVSNFMEDYHAYKGNAYGLSNILTQTAFLKPKMQNRHLSNLLYAGQLTVPGPGVPPAIISGKIAAGIARKKLKHG
ncbi:MAG: phytoene dehydrogenase [Bacteroidetes bacterium GWE2_39_28]|nr:MAG: phytoene dehydrogenase [Bacteroidetes bacterium GWE2_39_28]OFY12674.1 MAG: phytoene dehydrogenase [Bacteroidetes bacterium GWF2_39_10]OFZ10132.1 MAG: phytoene dehydrogenase [Bacteroidetes bacterium RIFOXYC2_FULL_39_11]HCT94611.1 phytoene desaturase [Rikenellaceae bacterium]